MEFGFDNNVNPVEEVVENKTNIDGVDNEPISPEETNIQYDANGNPIQEIVNDNKEDDKPKEEPFALEVGTELEVGDTVYTVDANGNVIDANGNIFKEAKDVKDWIDSFEQEEKTNVDELNIENIQKALGVSITDENDQEVQYDNTPEGVKAYVEQVIENSRESHYQEAIEGLFQRFPFVESMLDYYRANGDSLEGWGQRPDRSNLVIDETNEQQQEFIIKTAWKEQNRKGNVDNYIAYLKSSGTLYATAQEELEGLQEADKAYNQRVKEQALKAEEERAQAIENYWNGVHEVIKSKSIAGYNIPESIVVNRNGKTYTATPEDFFNYLYRIDKTGRSQYNYDLEAEDPQARLNDDILRAYLKFTGGNYSNLVDLAINKKEVTKLVLKSKQNKKPSIAVRKPTVVKQTKETDLGY